MINETRRAATSPRWKVRNGRIRLVLVCSQRVRVSVLLLLIAPSQWPRPPRRLSPPHVRAAVVGWAPRRIGHGFHVVVFGHPGELLKLLLVFTLQCLPLRKHLRGHAVSVLLVAVQCICPPASDVLHVLPSAGYLLGLLCLLAVHRRQRLQ